MHDVPTAPPPRPRGASKFLFSAHPAKMAAIRYKPKLSTKSGEASPRPNPAPAIATKARSQELEFWSSITEDKFDRAEHRIH